MVSMFNKYERVQLSDNFYSTEFSCKCNYRDCKTTLIDLVLVEELQDIRDHYGKSVKINSAYRCDKHNEAVGGSNKSQHKLGTAADIKVSGVDPVEVAYLLDCWYPKWYGIGTYYTFTHLDVRKNKARWDLTKKEN